MRRSLKRSALFAAVLRRTYKQRAKARAETIQFLFRRRYNLAPTDPRFLAATIEDMLIDEAAHRHIENPKNIEEFEDPDFDVNAELAKAEAESVEMDQPNDFEDVTK